MEPLDALMQADVLELCGNAREAARLREESIVGASEDDVICYAYTLLWRNVTERAIELLEENVELHPDSWNAYDTLAEAYSQNGDISRALVNYTLAARLSPDHDQYMRIMQRIAELQGEITLNSRSDRHPSAQR
jgi:predicted Zn-dependent protease